MRARTMQICRNRTLPRLHCHAVRESRWPRVAERPLRRQIATVRLHPFWKGPTRRLLVESAEPLAGRVRIRVRP